MNGRRRNESRTCVILVYREERDGREGKKESLVSLGDGDQPLPHTYI
jgi:hypothetical protein